MTTDDGQTVDLAPGDITFDGEHLSVGGVTLAPGRYRIGTEAILTVAPVDEHDQDDTDH